MTSLSDMPEDILYRISSSLTNREVAHVGILSKSYHDLMRKRPILVFDYTHTPNLQDHDLDRMLGRYRREVRSMQSSLVRYNEQNIDLETFIFTADWWRCRYLSPEDLNLYNNCIALALQKGVRNLHLCMWGDYVLRVPAVMESPELFSAKYCLLQVEGPIISWPNLKRLHLLHAFLGSEAVFDSIIRGCPLLEDLELDYFDYEGEVANLKFKVVNLRNLKKVKARLGPTQSLEVIEAPKLESLVCRNTTSYRLDWIRQPFRYLNLLKLSLYNVRICDDFFLHLAQIFPKLEHLSLKCSIIRRIKISSLTLKIIHLAFIDGLEEAQFDVPSIALFKFRLTYTKKVRKLCFARTSKRWTSHLRIQCSAYVNTWWFIQLKDLILQAVKGSQTFLSINFEGRVIFNGLNLTEYSLPFHGIPEIEEFYITSMPEEHSSSSFQAVLENIFRVCRPKTLLFRNWGFYNYEHPRLLHDFLLPAAGTSDGWTHLSNAPRNCECVWRVTGIKVFGHIRATSSDDYFIKEGRGLELWPGASDCEAYLELLKVHEQNERFISGFKLKWRSCGMHISRILLPSPSTSSG